MSEPIGPEQMSGLPAPDEVAGSASAPSGASEPAPTGPDNEAPATLAPAPSATPADPRVDDALSRLAEIDQLPLAEQVEVFGDIHRRLAAVLADPDSQAQ